MENQSISFRARARTIDHLGKGQIADCPTAVSELWKNSFDAYARDVALYTIDGDFPCGAIIDNGCGMSIDQIVNSWLTIGTESKSTKKALSEKDRFNLKIRKTQGEKGIGRLSTAFLSPVTFLVTKRYDSNFSVLLIDWRLFENPYLSLEDIKVPVTTIDKLSDAPTALNSLLKKLKENVYFDGQTNSHSTNIKDAWERFSDDELDLNKNNNILTTQEKILEFCNNYIINDNVFLPWIDILNKVEPLESKQHGTALFLLNLNRELSLLTNSGDLAKDNLELTEIEKDLVDTLRAFVNPYLEQDESFSYEIFTINKNNYHRQVLSQNDVFNSDDFDALEHTVTGIIDEKGWFRGKVKAFGKDKGHVLIPPTISINQSNSVGPFEINIGTFELLSINTTLTERIHANLEEKAKKYAGLMIFRDDLRVLPYGRVDNDFFQIEERRSYNAGRHYWSNRRLFGSINLEQEKNRNLKDKSGREGFIKNQAAREFRILVSGLLAKLADTYFGGKSEERKELLELIKKEKEHRKLSQQKAKRVTQKSFNEALKKQSPLLETSLKKIIELKDNVEKIDHNNIHQIKEISEKLVEFDSLRVEMKTPIKPPKLGLHEDSYRDYRDNYNKYTIYLFQLKELINKLDAELYKYEPSELAKRHLDRNQSLLNSKLNKFNNAISEKINVLSNAWDSDLKCDRSQYYTESIDIIDNTSENNVESSLNILDSIYHNLTDNFTLKYNSILKALERISQGVNLDDAFSIAEEERAFFEEKTRDLQALAQLGISVEILAHELEETDAMVTKGLNSLPTDIKKHPGFILAYNSHKSLTNQIRFLSPLKISGYQARQDITGINIRDHIVKFFGDRFNKQRVDVIFGEKFLKIKIVDLPSRIYPAFINIIHNALYWVCFSEKRTIHIDLVNNSVIIANSGPEIDEDDISRLFEIFYSRRANGHGVGLYLCRENLAVASHKIRYSDVKNGDLYLIKEGANFIIDFNGLEK